MSNQNIQDGFLNKARSERLPVTIFLTSGVKLSGRVRGFDKYCVVFETSHQEQLIFKHAISTVVTTRNHTLPAPEVPNARRRSPKSHPKPRARTASHRNHNGVQLLTGSLPAPL